ncbi:MAG: 3-dehydroquinate dehydratase [Muribaculaceae bacterium]|nr:3-dehydroquinate dehydratase [Muribaculaceae bacterium]
MIAIINGPNLNRLGSRNKTIYGDFTLAELSESIRGRFPGEDFVFLQSNIEGELINFIQQCDVSGDFSGIVINPGAYAHYSYALADAFRDCTLPIVEVHISNIHAREDYRSRSVTAEGATGIISGFGAESYMLGVMAIMNSVGK